MGYIYASRFRKRSKFSIIEKARKGIEDYQDYDNYRGGTKEGKKIRKEEEKQFRREENRKGRQYQKQKMASLNRGTILLQNNIQKARVREYNKVFQLGR